MSYASQLVAGLIRDIPDFPKPGVVFKDITPLLADPRGFRTSIEELVAAAPADIDVVVGLEARGFLFAAPVALELGASFVPVRKPGKLPGEVLTQSFDLEYGSDALSVHTDAIGRDARVLVVDDVLATGGTIAATGALLRRLGASLVHVAVVLELGFLEGRAQLESEGIQSCSAVVTV